MDVKAWIEDPALEPAMIREFKARFRGLELQKEINRGTSVYSSVFNLLVLKGARDWMTGDMPKHDDLDDHHIVPKSWGQHNLSGRQEDTILNRTALTAETNRYVIKGDLPNSYIPRMIKNYGDLEVKKILATHLISPKAQEILQRDPFKPRDFEEFVLERQRTIQDAIQELLITEKIDVTPELRDLDAKIQQVELALRILIEKQLNGGVELVPDHLRVKVDERLQKALARNPSLDADHYETLHGQLEYFDLRELSDTIANKNLWFRFQEMFPNKHMLNIRFDQLAELRNGIRHSRSIDEITRKDGENALLWFAKILDLRSEEP